MKHPLILVIFVLFLATALPVKAQKNRSLITSKNKASTPKEEGNPAIVVDRRLAVLRVTPSLYSKPIQRLSVGRKVTVMNFKQADGVTFYRVRVSANRVGWMQSEAVIGKFRKKDDIRLFRLVEATNGFDQINKIVIFLRLFEKSPLRPAVLLRLGDLMEQMAIKLSKKVAKKLDRREMAASGAPRHSFYLNFPSLDRFGKIGVKFLFNLQTEKYHYDGSSWFEIIEKFPESTETPLALERLNLLKQKMDAKK